MALGAQSRDVLQLVGAGNGARTIGVALVAGSLRAKVMVSLLFAVSTTDAHPRIVRGDRVFLAHTFLRGEGYGSRPDNALNSNSVI